MFADLYFEVDQARLTRRATNFDFSTHERKAAPRAPPFFLLLRIYFDTQVKKLFANLASVTSLFPIVAH